MYDPLREDDLLTLPLRTDWPKHVRSAILNVVALVRIAMLAGRRFLVEEGDVLSASIYRLEAEVEMLREQLRIVGARMTSIDAHRRPRYAPTERMAILELRTMRGWSKAETARQFHVSAETIADWARRADDDSLLQTHTPVNRFPDLVRYSVQRIKALCPALGKAKIADTLARAGIHIAKTTVQRILKENTPRLPEPPPAGEGKQRRIVAKYPSHTWHADLTAVPISGGYWTTCVPGMILQRWPVCFWLLNVVDHFSRRSVGFAVFKSSRLPKK